MNYYPNMTKDWTDSKDHILTSGGTGGGLAS